MHKMGAQLRVSLLRMKLAIWIVVAVIVVSTIANFTVNAALQGDPQRDAQEVSEALDEVRAVTGEDSLQIEVPEEIENVNVSAGNLLLILLPMLAIILPLRTFRTMMNFGDSRKRYFAGLLLVYAVSALGLALCNSLWWPLEQNVIRDYSQTYNLIEVFGWDGFGAVGIFLYQAAFYFFVLTLFNLLFSGVKSPVSWVLWAVLIAAIPIGTSIASLRVHVADFFLALLFNDHLAAGVGLNLLLSVVFIAGAWLFTRHRTF
ncbi:MULTISPECIES: hypothetical protein [Saccharibacillus]|uniref:hypothetical protein n=1 Tax=Saccharibacillus TaxID=456492 RepID=UPI00123A5B94|nr:hypothetical protein [Saccharibacillus sp. WB 17]MWJ32082.1 hypothetical protein [Saccharibacillus sp. WB 17]